jgi:DNA-binding GntR family transcriptional regulator
MAKMSKASRAYQLIKDGLQSGLFAPGERLSEGKVARALGLSRVPVRESLLRLEAEGMLKSRGPYVGRYVAYIEDQKPEDVLHRYEVREIIEGQAARLAAKNMNGRSIDQLKVYYRQLEQSERSRNHRLRVKAGQNLHRHVVGHCGNPLLLEIWDAFHLAPMATHSTALEERILGSLRNPARHDRRLRSVVKAIGAHDATLAEREMRLHVREVTTAIRIVLDHQAREQMGFEG